MASRIDQVELVLWVADGDFTGHRSIRFVVPLPDPEFLAAVEQKWREYSERIETADRGKDFWGMIG